VFGDSQKAPMSKSTFRIFVSSTFHDLCSERQSIIRALSELSFPLSIFGIALIPTDLQRGASCLPPLEECLSEVGRSDLFILVIGDRYGTETSSGTSYTECEYDEATNTNVARLVFIKECPQTSDTNVDASTPHPVDKLKRFKDKVRHDVKCDCFGNADELRGHVMRDVFSWVLEQVPLSLTHMRSHIEKRFAGLKHDFSIINGPSDISQVVELVTSRRFAMDMRRSGIMTVYKAILQDLLEMGSLQEPTKVTDPIQRSYLLTAYIDHFHDSVSMYAAIAEAESLETVINHPRYTFQLTRAKSVAEYRAGRLKRAIEELKKLLRCARALRDAHVRGQACRIVGEFYAHAQAFDRALRWQWKSIRALLVEVETCPFCLARAFCEAGKAHACLRECTLATDRLGKALMIARAIPDREAQAVILTSLAQHYDNHEMLREAVASYVWASKLSHEADPESEASDINLLLGDVIQRRGREQVSEAIRDVRERADQIVLESLRPYNLDGFTAALEIRPNAAGDHW
jgi:tetratricopeptide (TPR) repeat protein